MWLLVSPPTGAAILDQLLDLTQQSRTSDNVPIDLAQHTSLFGRGLFAVAFVREVVVYFRPGVHEQSRDLDLEDRGFRSRIVPGERVVACPSTHLQVNGVVTSRAEYVLHRHIWYDAFLLLWEFLRTVTWAMLRRWNGIVDLYQDGNKGLLEQLYYVFLLARKIQSDADAR